MLLRMIPVMICALALASPAPAAGKTELKTDKEKLSYTIGVDMGKNLKAELEKQSVDIDPDIIAEGIRDALAGNKLLLTDEETQVIRSALQKDLKAKQEERNKALAEKNKKEGETFLARNKKKKGVKTLPNGLQYKVITEGKGPSPREADTVTVNYKGMFIDGTEFDSSAKRGKPATFQVNQVISGWSEALQLMKAGSKWEIVVPPDLGYGKVGTPGGPIGPNAVLVFELELVSVNDDTAK